MEKINLDLSDYKNSNNVLIKFIYISGMGGNILLDNFILDGKTSISNELNNTNFEIYPNPVKDLLYLNIEQEGNFKLNIYSMMVNF